MNDPRCLDDAGYLLGALSPAERQEFRRHLRHCLRCRTSLQRLAPVLGLLALVIPEDVARCHPLVRYHAFDLPDSSIGSLDRDGIDRTGVAAKNWARSWHRSGCLDRREALRWL